MKYTSAPDFLFRGFQRLPFVGIFPHKPPVNIKPELLDTLDLCDGITDIPEVTEELKSLIESGIVVPGDTPPVEHQKFRYHNNRYFPAAKWQITGRCNYRCKHCFNAVDNSPIFEEFTLDEAKNLIAEFERCGVQKIEITGGEPTLHPNFYEILAEISKANINVDTISTNGSTITPEMLSKIKDLGLRPTFRLSFDGVGYHDTFRGVKDAERKLLEVIKLIQAEGFPIKIETNVNIENIGVILPTAKLMDSLGIRNTRIIRTMETPRWFINCKKLFTGKDYYDFALKFAEDYLKEPHKMHINIWHALNIDPISGTVYPGAECMGPYRGRATVCGHNRGILAITNSGELSPCNQMSGVMHTMGISLGNVKETPLQNLISDEFSDDGFKMGRLRNTPAIAAITGMYSGKVALGLEVISDLQGQFNKQVEIFPKSFLGAVDMRIDELMERIPRCKDCKYMERCQGGCRLIGLAMAGSYMQRDVTKCTWFYGGYADRLEELMKKTGKEPLQIK
jgi:radical SAM protein with 4Fe4S-binding SPASM domain